jgi:hypothetical protein
MRLRTLALAILIACGLTAGAEAKKKSPYGAPPTARKTKVKRIKPNVKGHKVKARKVARQNVKR